MSAYRCKQWTAAIAPERSFLAFIAMVRRSTKGGFSVKTYDSDTGTFRYFSYLDLLSHQVFDITRRSREDSHLPEDIRVSLFTEHLRALEQTHPSSEFTTAVNMLCEKYGFLAQVLNDPEGVIDSLSSIISSLVFSPGESSFDTAKQCYMLLIEALPDLFRDLGEGQLPILTCLVHIVDIPRTTFDPELYVSVIRSLTLCVRYTGITSLAEASEFAAALLDACTEVEAIHVSGLCELLAYLVRTRAQSGYVISSLMGTAHRDSDNEATAGTPGREGCPSNGVMDAPISGSAVFIDNRLLQIIVITFILAVRRADGSLHSSTKCILFDILSSYAPCDGFLPILLTYIGESDFSTQACDQLLSLLFEWWASLLPAKHSTMQEPISSAILHYVKHYGASLSSDSCAKLMANRLLNETSFPAFLARILLVFHCFRRQKLVSRTEQSDSQVPPFDVESCLSEHVFTKECTYLRSHEAIFTVLEVVSDLTDKLKANGAFGDILKDFLRRYYNDHVQPSGASITHSERIIIFYLASHGFPIRDLVVIFSETLTSLLASRACLSKEENLLLSLMMLYTQRMCDAIPSSATLSLQSALVSGVGLIAQLACPLAKGHQTQPNEMIVPSPTDTLYVLLHVGLCDDILILLHILSNAYGLKQPVIVSACTSRIVHLLAFGPNMQQHNSAIVSIFTFVLDQHPDCIVAMLLSPEGRYRISILRMLAALSSQFDSTNSDLISMLANSASDALPSREKVLQVGVFLPLFEDLLAISESAQVFDIQRGISKIADRLSSFCSTVHIDGLCAGSPLSSLVSITVAVVTSTLYMRFDPLSRGISDSCALLAARFPKTFSNAFSVLLEHVLSASSKDSPEYLVSFQDFDSYQDTRELTTFPSIYYQKDGSFRARLRESAHMYRAALISLDCPSVTAAYAHQQQCLHSSYADLHTKAECLRLSLGFDPSSLFAVNIHLPKPSGSLLQQLATNIIWQKAVRSSLLMPVVSHVIELLLDCTVRKTRAAIFIEDMPTRILSPRDVCSLTRIAAAVTSSAEFKKRHPVAEVAKAHDSLLLIVRVVMKTSMLEFLLPDALCMFHFIVNSPFIHVYARLVNLQTFVDQLLAVRFVDSSDSSPHKANISAERGDYDEVYHLATVKNKMGKKGVEQEYSGSVSIDVQHRAAFVEILLYLLVGRVLRSGKSSVGATGVANAAVGRRGVGSDNSRRRVVFNFVDTHLTASEAHTFYGMIFAPVYERMTSTHLQASASSQHGVESASASAHVIASLSAASVSFLENMDKDSSCGTFRSFNLLEQSWYTSVPLLHHNAVMGLCRTCCLLAPRVSDPLVARSMINLLIMVAIFWFHTPSIYCGDFKHTLLQEAACKTFRTADPFHSSIARVSDTAQLELTRINVLLSLLRAFCAVLLSLTEYSESISDPEECTISSPLEHYSKALVVFSTVFTRTLFSFVYVVLPMAITSSLAGVANDKFAKVASALVRSATDCHLLLLRHPFLAENVLSLGSLPMNNIMSFIQEGAKGLPRLLSGVSTFAERLPVLNELATNHTPGLHEFMLSKTHYRNLLTIMKNCSVNFISIVQSRLQTLMPPSYFVRFRCKISQAHVSLLSSAIKAVISYITTLGGPVKNYMDCDEDLNQQLCEFATFMHYGWSSEYPELHGLITSAMGVFLPDNLKDLILPLFIRNNTSIIGPLMERMAEKYQSNSSNDPTTVLYSLLNTFTHDDVASKIDSIRSSITYIHEDSVVGALLSLCTHGGFAERSAASHVLCTHINAHCNMNRDSISTRLEPLHPSIKTIVAYLHDYLRTYNTESHQLINTQREGRAEALKVLRTLGGFMPCGDVCAAADFKGFLASNSLEHLLEDYSYVPHNAVLRARSKDSCSSDSVVDTDISVLSSMFSSCSFADYVVLFQCTPLADCMDIVNQTRLVAFAQVARFLTRTPIGNLILANATHAPRSADVLSTIFFPLLISELVAPYTQEASDYAHKLNDLAKAALKEFCRFLDWSRYKFLIEHLLDIAKRRFCEAKVVEILSVLFDGFRFHIANAAVPPPGQLRGPQITTQTQMRNGGEVDSPDTLLDGSDESVSDHPLLSEMESHYAEVDSSHTSLSRDVSDDSSICVVASDASDASDAQNDYSSYLSGLLGLYKNIDVVATVANLFLDTIQRYIDEKFNNSQTKYTLSTSAAVLISKLPEAMRFGRVGSIMASLAPNIVSATDTVRNQARHAVLKMSLLMGPSNLSKILASLRVHCARSGILGPHITSFIFHEMLAQFTRLPLATVLAMLTAPDSFTSIPYKDTFSTKCLAFPGIITPDVVDQVMPVLLNTLFNPTVRDQKKEPALQSKGRELRTDRSGDILKILLASFDFTAPVEPLHPRKKQRAKQLPQHPVCSGNPALNFIVETILEPIFHGCAACFTPQLYDTLVHNIIGGLRDNSSLTTDMLLAMQAYFDTPDCFLNHFAPSVVDDQYESDAARHQRLVGEAVAANNETERARMITDVRNSEMLLEPAPKRRVIGVSVDSGSSANQAGSTFDISVSQRIISALFLFGLEHPVGSGVIRSFRSHLDAVVLGMSGSSVDPIDPDSLLALDLNTLETPLFSPEYYDKVAAYMAKCAQSPSSSVRTNAFFGLAVILRNYYEVAAGSHASEGVTILSIPSTARAVTRALFSASEKHEIEACMSLIAVLMESSKSVIQEQGGMEPTSPQPLFPAEDVKILLHTIETTIHTDAALASTYRVAKFVVSSQLEITEIYNLMDYYTKILCTCTPEFSGLVAETFATFVTTYTLSVDKRVNYVRELLKLAVEYATNEGRLGALKAISHILSDMSNDMYGRLADIITTGLCASVGNSDAVLDTSGSIAAYSALCLTRLLVLSEKYGSSDSLVFLEKAINASGTSGTKLVCIETMQSVLAFLTHIQSVSPDEPLVAPYSLLPLPSLPQVFTVFSKTFLRTFDSLCGVLVTLSTEYSKSAADAASRTVDLLVSAARYFHSTCASVQLFPESVIASAKHLASKTTAFLKNLLTGKGCALFFGAPSHRLRFSCFTALEYLRANHEEGSSTLFSDNALASSQKHVVSSLVKTLSSSACLSEHCKSAGSLLSQLLIDAALLRTAESKHFLKNYIAKIFTALIGTDADKEYAGMATLVTVLLTVAVGLQQYEDVFLSVAPLLIRILTKLDSKTTRATHKRLSVLAHDGLAKVRRVVANDELFGYLVEDAENTLTDEEQ